MLNVATGTKWVLGNWKMNGRLASNQALLAALLTDAQVNVAHVGLAVPTVYMAQVAQALSGQPMAWGGQAVSRFAADGAYTGEVSAAMLADLGASFTLVGHSERRQYFAESDEVLSAHYTERLQLAGRIHMAIDRGEFLLHFQPIMDASEGSPVALEALLRWPQADGSFIAPADFIQLCEDTGLIIALGRWVIHAAARAQKQLSAAGWQHLPIAVNVSAVQLFNSDLVGEFSRAMQDHGLARGALQMELTESVLMRNPTQALQTLGHLHANGVGVALDDFGTGFSSMSYLQHLPLDSLKIDRGFVSDVETNPRNAAICRALLSLGHSMGLSVIAEGVETEGQRRWLAAHGCDQVQGYLLGRPMPLEQVLTMLADSRSV